MGNYKESSLPRPNALNIVPFPIKKCLESHLLPLPLPCVPDSSPFSPHRPGCSELHNLSETNLMFSLTINQSKLTVHTPFSKPARKLASRFLVSAIMSASVSLVTAACASWKLKVPLHLWLPAPPVSAQT